MSVFNIDQLGVPSEIEAEVKRLSATYEFERLADKGQNGHLFFARNRVLDRRVAIKFYYWADGTRVHVEPKSLASVKSEAIIEILEASVVGQEWALFVTPYCKNGDLDRFRGAHRFGLKEALRFTESLLHGISALHKARMVHRDLKPENILVSDYGMPLIADFGSVRVMPQDESSVAGSGHAVLYRPPESFANRTYDYRGDVYQCGIVLYQLLGGRLVYDGLSYLEPQERALYAATYDDCERTRMVDKAIEHRVINGTLLELDTLPAFIPSSLRRVVRKATDTNPLKRYQHPSDMASGVHKLLNSCVDWVIESSGEEVARSGNVRYRLIKLGTAYQIEQDRGHGWRKLPGTSLGTLATQLKVIAERAGC